MSQNGHRTGVHVATRPLSRYLNTAAPLFFFHLTTPVKTEFFYFPNITFRDWCVLAATDGSVFG